MKVFDIETGPLPEDELWQRVPPFEPPPPPGEFDAATVKLGNLKNEEKRKEKIDAARQVHQAAVQGHKASTLDAEQEWWANVVDKAALSPLTGQVLAIGYCCTEGETETLDIREEAQMLEAFWEQYLAVRQAGKLLVGHNIVGFDLPFLVGRSWLAKISLPFGLLERGGRYFDSRTFVDTMILWSVASGQRYTSLNDLAQLFGVGGKPEGVDGGMFAELLKTDREKAVDYLRNDLKMTAEVALRMGVL